MHKPLSALLLCACLLPALAARAQSPYPSLDVFNVMEQKEVSRKATPVNARTQKIATSPAAQGVFYTLVDNTPGFVPIETLNCKATPDKDFSGQINDPTPNGEWSTADMRALGLNGKGALDAHWGLQITLQYWQEMHGWNSFDKRGSKVINYVNFHNEELDLDGTVKPQIANAYWNTVPNAFYPTGHFGSITFENGNLKGLSTTDLGTVGHEFGHGINSSLAQLSTDGVESGPLDEGFSDIWGVCVKNYLNTHRGPLGYNGQDMLIWEGPRDVTNPTYAYPKYYLTGKDWEGNTTLAGSSAYNHQNSTVLQYWFYLLAVGGNGTNEKQEAYCIPALGIEKAEQIVLDMEQELVATGPGSTYLNAYQASIRTVQKSTVGNVHPLVITERERQAVREAWYAVGVGPKRPTAYAIAGPAWDCTTNVGTFILTTPGVTTDVPPAADWTITPAGVVASTSANGVNSITITRLPGASGFVTITATNTCAGIAVSTQTIKVGNPTPTGIQGEYNAPPRRVHAHVDPVPTAVAYNWRVNSVMQSTRTNDLTFPIRYLNNCDYPEDVEVQVDYGNSCGTSDWIQRSFLPLNCGSARMEAAPAKEAAAYPNPANEYVMVSAERLSVPEASRTAAGSGSTVALYNGFGQKVYSCDFLHTTYRLDTSALPNGIYTLSLTNGNRTVRQQLVIQH